MPHISEEDGFVQLPNDFVRAEWLSAGAKTVYAILRSYVGGELDAPAFPGQDTLARQTGTDEKTVRVYLDELETLGLVYTIRRGQGRTNNYFLDVQSEEAAASSPELATAVKTQWDMANRRFRGIEDQASPEEFRRALEKRREKEQRAQGGASSCKITFRDVLALFSGSMFADGRYGAMIFAAYMRRVNDANFTAWLIKWGFTHDEIQQVSEILCRSRQAFTLTYEDLKTIEKECEKPQLVAWLRSIGSRAKMKQCFHGLPAEKIEEIWKWSHS